MEEIFGNKPWVKPLSTQSSTVNYSIPSAEKVSNDELRKFIKVVI